MRDIMRPHAQRYLQTRLRVPQWPALQAAAPSVPWSLHLQILCHNPICLASGAIPRGLAATLRTCSSETSWFWGPHWQEPCHLPWHVLHPPFASCIRTETHSTKDSSWHKGNGFHYYLATWLFSHRLFASSVCKNRKITVHTKVTDATTTWILGPFATGSKRVESVLVIKSQQYVFLRGTVSAGAHACPCKLSALAKSSDFHRVPRSVSPFKGHLHSCSLLSTWKGQPFIHVKSPHWLCADGESSPRL